MRASRFGILLAGGWHCFCPGGWTDADADGGSNRTRGYATVRRDTESLDRSERVLAEEERVRLRPRLPVRAWKTHASKWDYIKGRFIITASRASGARAEVTSPHGPYFSKQKLFVRQSARGETPIWRGIYMGHRFNLLNGPRRPCLQSQCNGRGVPYSLDGVLQPSAFYFIISWEPAFAHMK